ncbi:E3 ubiquitin-protein ligase TRIM45-like [Saccostrea echinata]|uniref:E3 ubiquitin-protein ligase TRIM45-like n=1 Tax=Saccostrea echinata TaxID=191078 RepID=UPI002A83573B|nr:E3 ubiquitin-protein ligase TRIM45-like [Saccostrea echinata]
MAQRLSAQDILRCDMCETNMVQMHCDTCLFSLCKACVGEHTMSDESNKKHEIVKFTFRQSTLLYPGCTFHDKKRCEMYCNQCDVPVCISCIISDHHLGHKIESILRILNEKKENIIKEGNELNETIYPTYHDIENDVENMMKQLEKEYGDIATAITKHGDDWCNGIVDVVKKLKTEANEMKTTQLQTLQKHRDKIHERITEIKDEIHSIDIAVDSYEISNPLGVKSNVDD